jgi:hypothetical protein
MGDLKSQLRRLLVERAKQVPLAHIAEESGIDRSCLNLFRNRQRDLSPVNIEKLRTYFNLLIELKPALSITNASRPLPRRPRRCEEQGGPE